MEKTNNKIFPVWSKIGQTFFLLVSSGGSERYLKSYLNALLYKKFSELLPP